MVTAGMSNSGSMYNSKEYVCRNTYALLFVPGDCDLSCVGLDVVCVRQNVRGREL